MTFQRKGSSKSFEELLIEHKIITQDKLLQYTQRMSKEKKSLEQILSEAGISDEKIAPVKAEFLGYIYEDVTNYPLSSDLLKHIKPSYAKNYKVLPLKYDEEILTIAMVEPRDFIALDEITRIYRNARFKIKEVKIVMSSIQCIYTAIDKFYAIPKEKEEIGIGSILDQVKETYKSSIEVAEVTKDDATENSAPVVMLANKIVEEAFQKRTSDIHLEPTLDFLRIRYRIDGDLTEVMRVPKYAQDALITRFKIMCDMRIDEKRQPQDGRIDFTKYNPSVEIDLRVSTVPTPHGEDVVMRILDKKSSILNLDMLGFSDHNMKLYKEALNSPYGILLHVGPTGSGKSTALFAALKTLDTPDVKIVTAEDPVEYTLGGQIIQSNIHPAAGYTFAKAMRAFMRHDPDIILVGEIRDQETAKTAVEASLTGHMVFSTLHTNDAVGTVTRLTEMGVEPYLVADSLILVCAQRLVRKICPNCKETYKSTTEEEELSKGDIKADTTLYRGRGCEKCDGSGYKGRIGIYEVLLMNKELRNLLIKNAGTDDLRKVALRTGMRTLRMDAIEKALNGTITLEQVISSTLADV